MASLLRKHWNRKPKVSSPSPLSKVYPNRNKGKSTDFLTLPLRNSPNFGIVIREGNKDYSQIQDESRDMVVVDDRGWRTRRNAKKWAKKVQVIVIDDQEVRYEKLEKRRLEKEFERGKMEKAREKKQRLSLQQAVERVNKNLQDDPIPIWEVWRRLNLQEKNLYQIIDVDTMCVVQINKMEQRYTSQKYLQLWAEFGMNNMIPSFKSAASWF